MLLTMNELIFLGYVLCVSTASLIALRLGKEGLTALFCVQAVLLNLFVTKLITLFGFTATASDALAVGITLSLNLLQEYYQKSAVQKAIWIGFFSSLFYTALTLFHGAYVSAPTDIASACFQLLLAPMPRIVLASLGVYLLVQHIGAALYGYLKQIWHTRFFVARNYGTLAFTQLIDTVLFSFLGLYGINESFSSISTLFDIIIVSYIIKLVVIIIAVPFVRLAKNLTIIQP